MHNIVKYSKLVEMLQSQMFMKNDPARYILASVSLTRRQRSQKLRNMC